MPQRRLRDELRVIRGDEPRAHRRPIAGLLDWEPPDSVEGDPAALAEWQRIREHLGPEELRLQSVDRALLEDYVLRYSQMIAAARYISEHGVLVPARSSADKARGAKVRNPALQIMREAEAGMRAAAKELGFSPASREALTLPEKKAELGSERLLSPAPPAAGVEVLEELPDHANPLRPQYGRKMSAVRTRRGGTP